VSDGRGVDPYTLSQKTQGPRIVVSRPHNHAVPERDTSYTLPSKIDNNAQEYYGNCNPTNLFAVNPLQIEEESWYVDSRTVSSVVYRISINSYGVCSWPIDGLVAAWR
jgi:hypothetical protein